MPTKEDKKQVKELIEVLEGRVHCGPPIARTEIQSVRDFLRERDFSPVSDYFGRLENIEGRVQGRSGEVAPPAKRNYGGEAAGYQMQVQSVYDHVILSTCYGGEFNGKRGRIKMSHRFNQEGRIEFVELKFLRALHPPLNGELRKLLLIKGYQSLPRDWHQTEGFMLRVLPQELIFLFPDVFRCERGELMTWLVNIGHGLLLDMLKELRARKTNGWLGRETAAGMQISYALAERANGDSEELVCRARANGNGADCAEPAVVPVKPGGDQLSLDELLRDGIAVPILDKAASLESVVEPVNEADVLVRYVRKGMVS
jgi:hypothetical protein